MSKYPQKTQWDIHKGGQEETPRSKVWAIRGLKQRKEVGRNKKLEKGEKTEKRSAV